MSFIQVKVHPRSRTQSLEQLEDGSYVARLKSPPVDGKANAELVALIAEHFDLPKAAVSIQIGAGSRLKRVTIDDSYRR